MISSLIFIATMVATGIPTALLFIPWCWLTGNVLPLYKGTRLMLHSSCRLAGVRFEVEGLERVPRDRACIFMSNHVSNLDPPALISLIPGRTSAFMKRSLMQLPILGTGFRQGEFIAVDRRGSAAAPRRAWPLPSACWPRACISPHLLKARAHRTAACCPSRKAPSSWPWPLARRWYRSPSTERKISWAKAACA